MGIVRRSQTETGEHASRLAADTVADTMRSHDRRDAAALTQSFEEANRRVMNAAHADHKLEGMGTTLSRRSKPAPKS